MRGVGFQISTHSIFPSLPLFLQVLEWAGGKGERKKQSEKEEGREVGG